MAATKKGKVPDASVPKDAIGKLHKKQETYDLVEKIIEGRYVGEGVRKTLAYETKLPKTKFDEWKKNFWGK
jgi:hypothetical protein